MTRSELSFRTFAAPHPLAAQTFTESAASCPDGECAADFGAFLQTMLDYVEEGPTSLDDVLRSIDAAWP